MAARVRAPVAASTGSTPLTRSPKPMLTAPELLRQRVVLTLAEMCIVLNLDRSSVLRKERAGKLPPRRDIAGSSVWRTADVLAWLEAAVESGPNEQRAEVSRRAAAARQAKAEVAP